MSAKAIGILVCAALSALSAFAAYTPCAEARRIRRILDFDGTINNDQGPTSTWRTYWQLERIDNQHTLLSPVPVAEGAPSSVFLSYREYLELVQLVGRNGLFNSTQPVRLEADPVFLNRPLEFVPGWYQVNPTTTFRFYRPASRGDGYLVRDLNYAEERTRILNAGTDGRTFTWQGPAWGIFAAGTDSPERIEDLVISTSRWHERHEWQAFFDRLKAMGAIAHSHGRSRDGQETAIRVHNLKSPESRLVASDTQELVHAKARVINFEATDLIHSRRLPGSVSDEPDILVVGEDDPRYVDSIVRQIEELSATGNFVYDVRFVFFNATQEQFLSSARYPFRWTTFERGRGRVSTAAEIAEILAPSAPSAVTRVSDAPKSCSLYFASHTSGGRR